MAKFTIALCILFVACAQGDIMEDIEAAIEALREKFQEQREKLEAAWVNVVDNAADFQEQIDHAVDAAIAQWQEQVQGISDNIEHVEQCVSSNVDFDEIVQDVRSTVEECVEDRRTTLQSDYESTQIAFDDFKAELSNVQESAANCTNSDGVVDWFWCLEQVWEETHSEVTESFNTLVKQVATLTVDFIAFENALAYCGWTEGLETLENEREAAYEEVKRCVADLEANE